MDKILVTGSSSGLGRYLYESLRAEAFIRNETINDILSSCTVYTVERVSCLRQNVHVNNNLPIQ